jgi:hypothetical protein
MNVSAFKRNELINGRLTIFFSLFILISVFVVVYSIMEDYKLAVQESLLQNETEYAADAAAPIAPRDAPLNPLRNPFNLILIFLWILYGIIFVAAFNNRLKPMLHVFLVLALIVFAIAVSWNVLVRYALEHPEGPFVSAVLKLRYPLSSKTLLLILWGFFSVYISFAYVSTKYLCIFSRLDYLFDSIGRGNWDAIMFFRKEDPFNFVADSFNRLKKNYLNRLFVSDEILIELKDRLSSGRLTPELRRELLDRLKEKEFGNTEPSA